MEVTDALIDKLAHLSRLYFDDKEKSAIKQDLQQMIGFVEKIKELDLGNITPLVHLGDETDIFREDEIKGSISRDEALRNAPDHDGQFFKVPKVIRK